MNRYPRFFRTEIAWSSLMFLKEKTILMEVEGKLRGAAVIGIIGTNACYIDFRCATVQVAHHMASGLPHRPIEEAFRGMAIFEQIDRNGCITTYLHPVHSREDLLSDKDTC